MRDFENKELHCIELNTGKRLSGKFSATNDEVKCSIYSYDERFSLDAKSVIILLAEDTKIISLHSNLESHSGTRYRRTTDRTVFHQEIISNCAIIGEHAWGADDRVKRVNFGVENTIELLSPREEFPDTAAQEEEYKTYYELSEIACKDLKIRIYLPRTRASGFRFSRKKSPLFEIEFDTPLSLQEYINAVSCCVSFFSMCLGVWLKPHSMFISKYASSEVDSDDTGDLSDHEVIYIWPSADAGVQRIWAGGSPVSAWNDDELTALRECLKAWVERYPKWKRAYASMMESLLLRGSMSGERLISACRWLEEIPEYKYKCAIKKCDIKQIIDAANKKANELGYTEISDRIAGAINRTKSESHEEYYKRIVSLVNARFGYAILSENAVVHAKAAQKFRGTAAHKFLTLNSERKFYEFSRSVMALESLCFLLMLIDLPISQSGLRRSNDSPLLEMYKRCFIP